MDERLAPGFPKHILRADGSVTDSDPLLIEAAAFLDTMPPGERVSADELATGIGVERDRAASILDQLEMLGHTGDLGRDGERPIFDPDGPTIPPSRT